MLSQLLKDKKKLKAKTPSKKSKGKWKEGRAHLLQNTENDEHSNSEPLKSSLKRRITQRTRVVIPRG